jgi:hypothetical protein
MSTGQTHYRGSSSYSAHSSFGEIMIVGPHSVETALNKQDAFAKARELAKANGVEMEVRIGSQRFYFVPPE